MIANMKDEDSRVKRRLAGGAGKGSGKDRKESEGLEGTQTGEPRCAVAALGGLAAGVGETAAPRAFHARAICIVGVVGHRAASPLQARGPLPVPAAFPSLAKTGDGQPPQGAPLVPLSYARALDEPRDDGLELMAMGVQRWCPP